MDVRIDDTNWDIPMIHDNQQIHDHVNDSMFQWLSHVKLSLPYDSICEWNEHVVYTNTSIDYSCVQHIVEQHRTRTGDQVVAVLADKDAKRRAFALCKWSLLAMLAGRERLKGPT